MKHPAPGTTRWALAALTAPTVAQLRLAHKAGVDPNKLLERFNGQYSDALRADVAKIEALVGDDPMSEPYRALMDELNKIAEDRFHDWWIAPRQAVARILNPDATDSDLQRLGQMVYRRPSCVVTYSPARKDRPTGVDRRRALRGAPRARARRPSARRSSGVRSGADPGSASDGEHAPAVLRVRRPSGRTAVFEADGLEVDGPLVWATGRWRRRVGLNYSETRYSAPGVYGFGPGEIVEVVA